MTRLTVLLALTLACASLAARPPERPKNADGWSTLRADEFEFVSNASPRVTMEVARNLLQMRTAIGQVTRLKVRSGKPTKVFIFATERAFAPYREAILQKDMENITGLFVPRETGNFILLQADGSREGIGRIVYHELTHYFVRNTVTSLPLWVSEGLAEYYSTFGAAGEKVNIGRPVTEHVLWLRDQRLIPLRDLLATTADSPIYNENDRQGVFYAQSWALMHYLMLGNAERRPQLSTFLQRVGKGESAEEAFAAFGVTYAALEQELRNYVRKRAFVYTTYTLSELGAPEVAKPEPMTYDAVLYELGHLLAYSHPLSGETASAFLNAALAANPAHPGAHADLGRVHELAGRRADADAEYERALQLGSGDAEMHVLYASSLLQRNENIQRARELFRRATELAPSDARAWAGLGTTYLAESGDAADGIAALETSLSLAPGDVYAALALTQLYANAGRSADARRLADRVIAPSGRKELIEQSRDALILADVRRAESLANSGKVAEAGALAKSLLPHVTNPSLKGYLDDFIKRTDDYSARQTGGDAINAAIEKAKVGKYKEALADIDAALPTLTDPEMRRFATQIRDELAKQLKK